MKRSFLGGGVFFLVTILVAAWAPHALCQGEAMEIAESPPVQGLHPASGESKQVKAPVVLGGEVLFYVQERVLSFTPEDRAKAIIRRVRAVSKNPLVSIESIEIVDAETSTDIVAGDLVLMTVTDRDARVSGRPRQQLAREHAESIRGAITKYRKDYSFRSIITEILLVVAATLVLILAIYVLNRVFIRLYGKIDSWKETKIPALKFQKFELLTSGQFAYLLIRTAKAAKILIILILFYIYVPTVLSFFPWSRAVSSAILSYVIRPLKTAGRGFIAYLPDLFFAVVIVFITFNVIKFTRFIFTGLHREKITLPGFYREWALPTYKIVRFLIIAFAAVMVFPYLPGADSPAFKGVSLFLGVLLSLGSSTAVGNVVAGIVLTYMRAYNVGDTVRISETLGKVVEKTLLVTHIRNFKNEDISIPNAMVLGSHIVNFSKLSDDEEDVILHTGISIGYDVPWKKVHDLLIEAAGSVEHLLSEPPPFVLQRSLDDFYVSYELNAYTDKPQAMPRIYSELHQRIQDRFNEAGVEIMSSHYTSLRDGGRSTIPDEHLPKSYSPPPFRVSTVEEEKSGMGPPKEEKKE